LPAHSHPQAARSPLTGAAAIDDPAQTARQETLMERPNLDEESALPPDPEPASDPDPTPRFPKSSPRIRDARPETLANNTQVTPLDPDDHAKEGIEVNET
jgi:hypothetical protein